MQTTERTRALQSVFSKVARNVASRYPGLAEAEDIENELWVYYLEHFDQENWVEVTDPDWATLRTLYTVAERYARNERTAKQGPGDTYTQGEVFALVELLVNPETNDEYERLGAEMAEVLTAVATLSEELRSPLAAKAAGTTYREIAEKSGVSVATAHRQVQQALAQIVNTLNGVQTK